MSDLFDIYNISVSGIKAHSTRMEVIGNNIANASNEDYTRQDVILSPAEPIAEGIRIFGQGVEVAQIRRIRDTLLDDQIRDSMASTYNQKLLSEWLTKIQTVYNEPSDSGINNALNKFWEAWSELSTDPENFAARTNVMTRTENLTALINGVDSKLERFRDEADQDMTLILNDINDLTEEIAVLNKDILEIEAGREDQANNLRDRRDAALNELAEKVDITYRSAENGMVNVFIGIHPAVNEDQHEDLIAVTDTLDSTKKTIFWEYGDRLEMPSTGELAAIMNIRDTIIPAYQSEVDSLAQTIITEVNKIYAQGVGSQGDTYVRSRLGYEALDVDSTTEQLSLLSSGEYGAIHVSFYDSDGNVTRNASVVVDSEDSLYDIQQNLDLIDGLDVSLLSSTTNDGQLLFELEPGASDSSFAVSNNTGGYDTSGFLSLLGFSQTEKTSNTFSSGAPVMTSGNTKTLGLATELGVVEADVPTTALGLSGNFTINVFEAVTQLTRPSTDPSTWTTTDRSGYNIGQFTIDVASTDSLTDITSTINTVTGSYGLEATINGDATAGYTLEITTQSGKVLTDGSGNVSSSGSYYVQLSMSNTYEGPSVTDDNPPSNYCGHGDDTDLLATMQFNTLFQGADASDIALDGYVDAASKVHAGYKLASGANELARDIYELQNTRVYDNDQFTINEQYQNIVSGVGSDVEQSGRLYDNENLLLEGFLAEKDSISGVNLDEELANMLLYQRAYDANARLLSAVDQMTQEILQLV